MTEKQKKLMLARMKSSGTYSKAYEDMDFMNRRELRPVRLQLELLKPELILREHKIHSTIVLFGSARIISPEEAKQNLKASQKRLKRSPKNAALRREVQWAVMRLAQSRYYGEAQRFAAIVSQAQQTNKKLEFVIVTGGGPGIMEAANRGAYEVSAKSVGLNITLPHEQDPNPYITPELSFQFHYFSLRKMHFMMRCKALVAFPGGFGTLDELFETLTLVQTGKKSPFPIVLFGNDYWRKLINFQFLVEQGMISPADLKLFTIVETAEEGWSQIQKHWRDNEFEVKP